MGVPASSLKPWIIYKTTISIKVTIMHIRKEILKVDKFIMFLSIDTNTNIPLYVVEDVGNVMDSTTFPTFNKAKEYLDSKKWDCSDLIGPLEALLTAKEYTYQQIGCSNKLVINRTVS